VLLETTKPRRRGCQKISVNHAFIIINVLNRQFTENRPNQKWVDDFTYIWTAEGWLYVAAVIDLLSRRVVGWSMNANMTAQLVTDALIMAFWRRGNQMHSCIILIKEANIRASSSSVS
jgi:putative transposase